MTVKLDERAVEALHELIPKHMVDAVFNYFEKGWRPGSFLSAVLANDLVGAVMHADHINQKYLKEYVSWLYWHAPGRANGAWGSRNAVEEWISNAAAERELADS